MVTAPLALNLIIVFSLSAASSSFALLQIRMPSPMMMAWIGGRPSRSLFAMQKASIRSALNGNRRHLTGLSSSSFSADNSVSANNDELQSKLRQLALLNGGKSINPRSPRQVSNLLYDSDTAKNGWNNSNHKTQLGPTDKATLQKMLLNDHNGVAAAAASLDGDGGILQLQKQKEIAKLVLQCRQLLASSSSNGDREAGMPVESFAVRAARGLVNERGRHINIKQSSASSLNKQHHSVVLKQSTKNMQVANFSKVAGYNHADVQEEEIIQLIDEENDTAVIAANALPPSPMGYTSSLSPYEQMVMDLFPSFGDSIDRSSNDSQSNEEEYSLDAYWIETLLSLSRPSARALVRQLRSVGCPMGYDSSAGPASLLTKSNTTTAATTPKRTTSLLSYIQTQKARYFSDTVVLVRVGDFYESYGIDAILLVEYCGLNPMAGKSRAGCPWRNVQSTLDGLTSSGLRVAVYEEWNGVGEMPSQEDDEKKKKSTSKKALKTRFMSQVVSSANPTYMHGLVLNDDSNSATDDAPTYGNGDISSSSPGRSYVGVIETSAGYTLVEVSAEERTAVVSERQTAEAVACRLMAYPPADPLFYVPSHENGGSTGTKRRLDRLPFLPWRHTSSSTPLASLRRGGDVATTAMGKVRVKTLPPSLVVSPTPGLTDVERAKQTIVTAFLRLEDDSLSSTSVDDSESSSPLRNGERKVVTHVDFVVVASSAESDRSDLGTSSTTDPTISNPLHLETATQLGLMSDPAIPPLVSSLLPDSAPASSRRFLRRWLLVPPPPNVADAMSQLVSHLKDEETRALPSLGAPPLTGKFISLIRAGQASAAVYREILCALDAASEVLLLDDGMNGSSGIVAPLMTILHHDAGTVASDSLELRARFLDAMDIIAKVVSTAALGQSLRNIEDSQTAEHTTDGGRVEDYISYFGNVVPPAFYERNEAIWRGRVKPAALEHAHIVPKAAQRLSEAIAIDFWGVDEVAYTHEGIIDLSNARESKSPVVQDIFNNILAIKSIPKWAKEKKGETPEPDETQDDIKSSKSRYFHPRDRNGKILHTRYTTERVQEAMSEYVESCDEARAEVERVLTKLAWDLVDDGHLPSVLEASHLNLILSTAAHHAANSNARGWSVGNIYDNDDYHPHSSACAGYFEGVWPYWMDRTESVSNSFALDGLFLLTAPNMSGKSTLMRSTAAAALFLNCGLCAPVNHGSSIRRFDSIFVRGAR